MKYLLLIAAGLLVAGVTYSMAPDVYRYLKIKSM
jgi:hypothetical protein